MKDNNIDIEMLCIANGKEDPLCSCVKKRSYKKFPFFVGDKLKHKTLQYKIPSLEILDKLDFHANVSSHFIENMTNISFSLEKFNYRFFSIGSETAIKVTLTAPKVKAIGNTLLELCMDYIAQHVMHNFAEYEHKYHPLVDESTLPFFNHTKLAGLPTDLIEGIYLQLGKRYEKIPEKLEIFFLKILEERTSIQNSQICLSL